MATANSNEYLCQISEELYNMVKSEIGSESRVGLQRLGYDLIGLFHSFEKRSETLLISGSKAEGFNFNSSDLDLMGIDTKVIVIDREQRKLFKTEYFPIAFLMDTENVQPGFTLLKCIKYDSRTYEKRMNKTLLHRGNDVYISSQRAQQIKILGGKATVHGPCRNGTFSGIEYDYAYTLKCPFWPKPAESFIYRSIRNGWPTIDNLRDICSDGCLLVPTSSKQQTLNDITDLEWRISFSLAEKKLVYSMNHCQFLCYGLMKLFLNEVLKELPETKTENDNVLCSYYMKTAVLWEMSGSVNDWSKRNFINKSMNVFRRLMRWIEDGYCPNFFVPEHNMFYGKIYGRRQSELLVRLRSLFDEGFSCFLRCTSFHDHISSMRRSRVPLVLLQSDQLDIDLKEFDAIRIVAGAGCQSIRTFDIKLSVSTLLSTAALIPSSEEMKSAMKLHMNSILQSIAMVISTRCARSLTANKSQYQLTMKARSILRKTKTSYCNNKTLQAVISYTNGEYNKTTHIVNSILQRLHRQSYMYYWDLDLATILECRQQGMSYEEIVRENVLLTYNFLPVTCAFSIQELNLECVFCFQNGPVTEFSLPPLVFLNFLLILSYTKLNQPLERKNSLDNLLSILYHDNNNHIHIKHKAISWEILGICQQICGYYWGAYQSFLNALNDKYNNFREATKLRIKSLPTDITLIVE